MTSKERHLLKCLQLCDLYTQKNGVMYRSIGESADIIVVERKGELMLQANVYPFLHIFAPLSQSGLEKCKNFVRRWAG